MHLLANRDLLRLLVKVYNDTITDYYYFPEVIYAGAQKLERAEFEYLFSEGLISLFKFDSFGRYYTLSLKGDRLLRQLQTKPAKKKLPTVPLTQGCFYFHRLPNQQANTARCLLFF